MVSLNLKYLSIGSSLENLDILKISILIQTLGVQYYSA